MQDGTYYQRIRLIREKRGYTQTDLASMCGYASKASIAHIEAGDYDLSQSALFKICEALNVSPNYILTGERVSVLTEDEKNLIIKYEDADPRIQEAIRILLEID